VAGNPIYYVEDPLGTSRVMTYSNGALCYDADFYPYGGERAYTNLYTQEYKFEGKERDTETGNDDFGARYYTSRFGRWLSADWSSTPIPVPYANLTNPQTLNLYSMVSDDPESFADLEGHCDFNSGCALELLRAVQNFADHPGEYIKAAVWGAVKQQLADTREALALKPAPELEPKNDVERLGAGLVGASKETAAVVLPIVDGAGGLLDGPGLSFKGPKEGSSGGPGAGKDFSPATKQAAVDQNAAANGGSARCVYCGDKPTNKPGPNKVNIDHKDAKANGGNNTLANADVTCQYCNQSKGTAPAPKTPKPRPDQSPQ
jgi:RHS repeat-associated protein